MRRPASAAALPFSAPSLRDPVWWLSFVSFSGLVFATLLGAPAIALCLAAWLPVAAGRLGPRTLRGWAARLCAWRLPWLLPLLALASCLWSDEPALSARLGAELVLFTAVGLVAADAQPARGFVSSFGCALLLGAVVSALSGRTAAIGTTGEVALVGIFGSKNNFACFVCLMMLAGAAVLGDPRQPRALRGLAACGLLLGPLLLLKAHSLGALFAAAGSLAALGGTLALARLAPRRRGVVLAVLAILAVCVAALAALAVSQGESLSSLLVALGKDPGLTGRAYLWSRAREYMADRPLLGTGYQAFWVQGHVEAEGLWRFAQIETRAGFHFHNTFYEAGVELGWPGIVALFATLAATAAMVAVQAVRQPDGPGAFLLGLFVFFALRLTVELDFLGPFSPGSLLLPAAWVQARGALQRRARPHRQETRFGPSWPEGRRYGMAAW